MKFGSNTVMAAGTVTSRLIGFVRNGMLVAAIGNGLHGDLFNIANTLPNMLYILLAGGVFNAVLVPQLVRSMKEDADGGAAYANRVITLAGVFLALASLLLVVAAPLLMRLFLDHSYYTSACASDLDSVITFARYCLPQVFFYGMFVLVGQILNSRGSFGPMMWAPIANNVVAIAVLGLYLFGYGPTATGHYSGGEEFLLGAGSTLGIAIQFAVLIPYLRKTGFTFQARFDWKNTGLGHTLRLGLWTVLFVVVNQLAFTVIVRLASGGTAGAAACSGGTSHEGTGFTIYTLTYLLVMVPHSVVTVSLATSALPRLSGYAADGDLPRVGREISATMRTTLAAVLPLFAVVPVIATDLASLTYAYGAGEHSAARFAPSLAWFAIGQVFYTVHYLALRGFYALEQNRRVFWIQCVVAVVSTVAAIGLTRGVATVDVSPRLVIAYGLSFLVGAGVAIWQLHKQTTAIDAPELIRFVVRLVVAVTIAAAVAWLANRGIHQVLDGDSKVVVLVRLLIVSATDLAVVVAAAYAMRIVEVMALVDHAKHLATALAARKG